MEDEQLTLYWGSGSPVSWRALMALELKRLPYASRRLDLSAKDHRSDWFTALNPRGTFPLLKHGDLCVRDSLAIVAYLDAAFPAVPLLGTDARTVAAVWQAVGDHDGFLAPAAQIITRGMFRKSGVADTEAFGKAIKTVHSEFERLDSQLTDKRWIVGETPTAAEVVCYPTIHRLIRAASRDAAKPWNLDFTPSADRYSRIAEWLGVLAALPGIDATYPPHWRT